MHQKIHLAIRHIFFYSLHSRAFCFRILCKMRYSCILLLLLSFGCSVHRDTRGAYLNKSKRLSVQDTLVVIRPYAYSGKCIHDRIIEDSIFDKHLEKYCYENKFCDAVYTMKGYKDIYGFFRKRVRYLIPSICDSQQRIIDSLVRLASVYKKTPQLDSSIFSALSSIKGNYFLLSDIIEYYENHAVRSNMHDDYFLMQVYLLDKRMKSIVYYGFAIQSYLGHDRINSPHLKRALYRFRVYLPKKDNLSDRIYEGY